MQRALPYLASALVVLATASVSAQPSDATLEQYRQVATAGQEAFNRGDYPEARRQWEHARSILPNPRVYALLARVAEAQEQRIEAVQMYRLALSAPDNGNPLTPARRQEIEGVLLPRALSLVAELRIEVEPAEAELTLDGRPVRLEDGALLVAAGSYVLRARRSGYVDQELRVQAQRGPQAVRITLVREGDAAQSPVAATPAARRAPAATPGEVSAPAASAPEGGGVSGAGLALTIAGGVAVAAGAVFLGLGWSDAGAVDGTPYYPDVADAAERAQWMIPTGYVVAGVGLAALAVGVVVLMVDGGGERSSAALRLGPGGLELRGRF